ncbi:MAG: TonB-dependent receptor [Pseudomonadota bacterium]|nr:TonB-dependent receptor [Pseudomonadota bacterium]
MPLLALQGQNLSNTTELRRLVPDLGYVPQSTVANNVFMIRGIGTQANGNGLEQSVGVNYDGVALGRSLGSVSELVDIQQVEVLKGPQGMLFGKNASAGVINIQTQVPKLGVTEQIGRLSYGSLNDVQATDTVNVPISDNSALRLSAWKFRHDGFGTEVNTGQKFGDENTEGARLRLRWLPSDGVDLNLTSEFTSHDQNPAVITIRQFEPANFTRANSGALIQAWELAHGTAPRVGNNTMRGVVSPYGYYDRGSTAAFTGQADFSVGGGTLTSVVSYRTITNSNPFDPYPTDNPYNTSTYNFDYDHYNPFSAEVRYASPAARRIRYVAGLYFYKMSLHEQFLLAQGGSPVPAPVNINWNMNVDNETHAAFGEATFDLTDALHFTAGVRQSRDIVSGNMSRDFIGAPPPTVLGFNTPGGTFGIFQTAADTTYNNTSWRFGLQYQVDPSTMLYATASRGYKGPGLAYGFSSTRTGLAQANNGIVKPEIANAVEVGVKSQWFERRLTVNLAAFDEKFDNFQVSLRVPGPVLVFVTQNAKQLRSDGASLDVNWQAPSGLQLTENFAYTHARFTDYLNASCYPNEPAPRCTAATQNLNGWPLANAPRASNNVTARFERPLVSNLSWFGQVNDNYRSSVVFNTIADPHDQQGAVNLINLAAGLNAASGRWGVSLYGNNVANRQFVDRIANSASGAFYVQQKSYADLRTYGAAVNIHF